MSRRNLFVRSVGTFLCKTPIQNRKGSALTLADYDGEANIRMPATESDTPLYANIAERSSFHMRQKRGDTAQRIVMHKHGVSPTKSKGKSLSQKKLRAERSFLTCLQIVNVLFVNGLLTEKETVRD